GPALHRGAPVQHLRPRAVSPAFLCLGHRRRCDHRPRSLRLRGSRARGRGETRALPLSGLGFAVSGIPEGMSGMDIRKIKKLIEHVVSAPMVGTFYAAPTAGAKPFVEIGDEIKVGQVLCIIEAMKMMNQIEADRAGRITSIMAQNGDPVEFGQPLFVLE